MKRFPLIEKIDNGILFTLEFISSVSVLFLAVGLIASVANVLTGGEVISSNEIGKQFYAWSQAIGIDASIPGVILRLALCIKTKDWFRLSIYAVLSALVLFTAFNISNVESISQSLNKPLEKSYADSLVSLDMLVTIRSLTVILLIVSHALKGLHGEPVQTVKVVKAKSVQPTPQHIDSVTPTGQKERTPKEPTPIHKNFDRVKAYLADHPNATAREVGRELGLSATAAAKWVKRIKASA